MYARKYIGMWACMRVCLCLCAGGQGERVVGDICMRVGFVVPDFRVA